MEHCEELLPGYLRFIRGVVDSADLPLNVSRQRLQEDRHITQIRKWLTKKVIDSLEEMQAREPENISETITARPSPNARIRLPELSPTVG
jgi:molecular chaperone HtpG